MRSLVPSLLLAAGVLVATLISLKSSSSFLWALAGPFVLAAIVVMVATIANQSRGPAWIMGGALFLSGAIVALADAASVPLMMPILGTCAAVVLMPRRRCGVKHGA